jgi:hypothetical protein
MEANEDETPDRILLSAGTYVLSRFGGGDNEGGIGDLDILTEIEIVGPGATMTKIDADDLGEIAEEEFIGVSDGAKLTIRGVFLTNGDDGAIRVFGAELVVEECEIFSNAFNGPDAGIRATTEGGKVTVRNSSIVNNGAGIAARFAEVELENVTLHSNAQVQLSAGDTEQFTCTHCTIEDQIGGDPEVSADDATIRFTGSIVRGDCSATNGGSIESDGGNLESPGTSCGFATADLEDVDDPGLTSYAHHGGPTRTFDLEADSPALGLVLDAFCSTRDQRGASRSPHTFADCDSGAVERTTPAPPAPIFVDGFEQGDDESWTDSVLS